MMRRSVQICILGMVVFVTAAGCSSTNPDSAGKVQIILKDTQTPNIAGSFASASVLKALTVTSYASTSSMPTVSADFNCFFLNISGQGINKAHGLLDNCTFTDNLHGHGLGLGVGPVVKGQSIEVDIPGGPARSIDVYGVFPSATECGQNNNNSGPGGGFWIGGVTQDLKASATVTIPVSYDLSPPQIMCHDIILPMNGVSGTGATSGGACAGSATLSTTTPAPGLAATALTSADYSLTARHDNNLDVQSCHWTTNSTADFFYVEYTWPAAGIDFSKYSQIGVEWAGLAGLTTWGGSCGTSFSALGGGTPSVDIWQGPPANQWQTVGAVTTVASTSVLQQSFSNPASFVHTDGLIHVRVKGGIGAAAADCSAVATDYILLFLEN